MEPALPVREVELIEPDGVVRRIAIKVLLVVDRNAVPTGRIRGSVNVKSRGLSIQGDGLEQQLAARRSLHLDCEVIPRIILRIAWHTSWDPMFFHVVPSVPFVASRKPTFVTPDE